MLIFVVYKEDEQEQQFAATLVYEDGARCYVGSSLSADLNGNGLAYGLYRYVYGYRYLMRYAKDLAQRI